METLHRFLEEASHASLVYKNNIDENLNVCLGNVSCDMDSAVGAILLAYYLTYKNEYYKDVGNFENLWIPVINCPRSEITARLDVTFHFKSCGIDLNTLVYIDDFDLQYYSNNKSLKLAIIDHNKMDYSQMAMDDSVVMIVDHHVDLKAYPNAKKILEFCGSACSLVINMIFEDKLHDLILTAPIVKFFSSAILIDTENFKSALKGTKWSSIDEQAFISMNRVVMRDYYNELITKKTDRSLNLQLGLELILRKDYKTYTWNKCIAGISVIFNPLHEILTNFQVENLRKTIKERMIRKELNIYLIISQTYTDSGEAHREIMIFDEDPERLGKISALFESKCTYALQKKKFTGLSKNFNFYLIKDESVSRKKVEPIFKEIFEIINPDI
jgi:inorganic pyrophosphatase/exopolyphosphatase